jgi:glycosyltransferase involved in cell wall biosynthesis
MACGLPVMTSNGSYMDDIVDDSVAVRVDPTDVRVIREAIVALMNDPVRRKSMSQACLEKSKQFDINLRARSVTAWLEELLRDFRAKRTEVAPTPANDRRRESLSDPPKKTHGSRSAKGAK